MTENKTKPTEQSVAAFINDIDERVLEQLIDRSVKFMSKNYATK